MRKLFFYLAVLSMLLQAQPLFVTDKSNFTVLVNDPKIYYTSKNTSSLNLFYSPDIETTGIRIQQGLGTTVVKWNDIRSVRVKNKDNNGTNHALLSTHDSNRSISLTPIFGAFEAQTNLGNFNIDLENIECLDVISENHMRGEMIAILQYQSMKKSKLPNSIKKNDTKKLLSFATDQLKLRQEDLHLTRLGQYIIIHYNNPEYEAKHPRWKIKKFGEAIVINISESNFVAFRLSKT